MNPIRETIPVFDLEMEPGDIEAVEAVLRRGAWGAGEAVRTFETEFAAMLGARHVVATSSCTAALHLALLAAGIGPGDEVVVPAFTFAATVSTIVQAGATPVFVDIVGERDLNVDPAAVESAIGPRTKAVMIVHYAGYGASPGVIAEICARAGITMLEDSAHAPHGFEGEKSLGTFGLAGAFSFFPNKILGIGEAGALCSDDPDLAARARTLANAGFEAASESTRIGRALGEPLVAGYNYRLDEMRAGLLSARLRRLRAEVERRRELSLYYRHRLAGVPGIVLPFSDAQVRVSSAYSMAVLMPSGATAGRRDAIRRAMQARGVQTTMMYPGVHQFSAYRERFPGVRLPRTEAVASRQITLPLFGSMKEAEIDRVVSALSAALEESRELD